MTIQEKISALEMEFNKVQSELQSLQKDVQARTSRLIEIQGAYKAFNELKAEEPLPVVTPETPVETK